MARVLFVMTFARASRQLVGDAVIASVAMTGSQRAEMFITSRPPSEVPVRVVEGLTGRRVPDGLARWSVGHLAQGGLAVQAVAFARFTRKWPPVLAAIVNASALVFGDALLAHRAGAVDPLTSWAPADVGIDVLHKASLAGAATALTRRRQWATR